jgi:hypothetical protein
MIRVKPDKNQFILFPNPFDEHLDLNNRWVKFSQKIPWDKIEHHYTIRMDKGMGTIAKDSRLVVGALIIKHHENLSDEATIQAISENLYMQYFVGLPSFSKEQIFTPSLFVEIRKRLGADYWSVINELIIEHNQPNKDEDPPTLSQNQGTINIDATIVEQDITYPTDLKILNDSREKLEEIIDVICLKTHQTKPRTYRRVARRDFLNTAKKKNCSYKEIRKSNGKQLSYVYRNLKHVDNLLAGRINLTNLLNRHQLKYLQVIQTVFEQQHYMYKNRTNKVSDRIVSIHQPHVRPMVRGKAGSPVEFGSKIGITIHDGLTFLDTLSWNNYNEADDLKISAENYFRRNNRYPAKINADQKYMTRENRNWCKERGIHLAGKPLGRSSKLKKEEQQNELRKSASERNCVEGKFGQAKRRYSMDNIKARLQATSESMIGAIVVVLNLIRLVQQHVHYFVKLIYFLLREFYQKKFVVFLKPTF